MGDLPHGYTLDQLARMARHVVRTHPGQYLEFDEAQDIAACALVDVLYTAESPPSHKMLFQAGCAAVSAANNRHLTFLGVNKNAALNGRSSTRPGWATYWRSQPLLVAPWEETLCERLAVVQVWRLLTERHRETLRALVEYGSAQAARESLDITAAAWHNRLFEARRRARQLWHAPEPAPLQWGRDRAGRDEGNRAIQSLSRRRRAARSKQKETAA